jgi:archaellum component FlaG (FlaF/FlaG flagellin family)
MNPEWVAAIIVIVVNLFTAGVVYGSLQSQTKNNTKAIDDLKQEVAHEQDQQWKVLNAHTEDIGYLHGRTGNGLAKSAGAGN